MSKSKEISGLFSIMDEKSMALIKSGVNSIKGSFSIKYRRNAGKYEFRYSVTEEKFTIAREEGIDDIEDVDTSLNT